MEKGDAHDGGFDTEGLVANGGLVLPRVGGKVGRHFADNVLVEMLLLSLWVSGITGLLYAVVIGIVLEIAGIWMTERLEKTLWVTPMAVVSFNTAKLACATFRRCPTSIVKVLTRTRFRRRHIQSCDQ